MTAAWPSARTEAFHCSKDVTVTEHSPLPPEPATTTAGRTVGALMWVLVLVATALVLMGIWGVGDTLTLIKTAATAGLVVLVGAITVMALRR